MQSKEKLFFTCLLQKREELLVNYIMISCIGYFIYIHGAFPARLTIRHTVARSAGGGVFA